MIALDDIEKRFDLSNWERKLGNKRTKAGKNFWLFVLFNYKEAMIGNKVFDIRLVCEEYYNVFYRRYEAIVDLLGYYEGVATAKMKHDLIIEGTKKVYSLKFKKSVLELESRLRSFLKDHEVSYNNIAPESAELIDLDFLDHKQTHLPLISDAYKRLLRAANHIYKGDKLMIDTRWGLKPSTVKDTFNTVMDKLIIYKYIIDVVDHIRHYLNTSYDTFRVKTRIDGPTAALYHTLSIIPDTSDYSDKQLKYHLKLNYCGEDGQSFKNGSVRKAIKIYRDES